MKTLRWRGLESRRPPTVAPDFIGDQDRVRRPPGPSDGARAHTATAAHRDHKERYSSDIPEPTIVVERRKELTYLLCQGAELEHALMCQYLFAAFSLKRTAGPGVTAEQVATLERWRSTILSISREEMLHWSMVQNLLVAVGSAPFVSRPHMPHQAKGYPPGVQLRLLPFGQAALEHFVFLERPEGMDLTDAEVFDHGGASLPQMSSEEIVPRPQHFNTQGDLYRSIEEGLVTLAHRLGEGQLFIGPAFHQSGEGDFSWPDLAPIVDLDSALSALERIVQHGEGARGDWSEAHFGRFLGILKEHRGITASDSHFEPAHPVVGAGMRAVEGVEPEYYITNRSTGMVSDLFNAAYELLLQMIARYFAFGHETPEQQALLAEIAVDLMYQVIDPLGNLLATLEVGPERPGLTAGANFQLPYRSNFLLPHRRSSWIRFVERLSELAGFARAIGPFDGDTAVSAVADAVQAMADRLRTQIEDV